MRAAAIFVDLTLFSFREPRTSRNSSKGLGGAIGRGKLRSRRRDGRKSKSAPVMVLRAILEFIKRVFVLIIGFLRRTYRKTAEYRPVRYYNCPLSPLTATRLYTVHRKIMVLDLDETLIHSHHDGSVNPVIPTTAPDFIVRVRIECHPVRFYVHKRPHVDFFLSMISQWYELVIFTASLEMYGMAVANRLDNNRNIFQRRFFRQHCTMDLNGYVKDLGTICPDLANVFILDNSPSAYRGNPDNAIPIKSWFSDAHDTALLDLLPLLDALRFTNDVRSVLSRNLHAHSLY